MSQKIKRKILVVSRNPTLAQIRKRVCEGAGFTVIAATNASAVEPACRKGIELILIGYSVAPSDKRRVWAKSRQYGDVPIMELQRNGNPELIERNVFADESNRARAFLTLVQKLPLGETRLELEVWTTLEPSDPQTTSSRMAERKVFHEHEAQKDQAIAMRDAVRQMGDLAKKTRDEAKKMQEHAKKMGNDAKKMTQK